MARKRRLARRLAALGLGLSLLASLTGCWNNEPVEHRELVMAIGIEPAPHHEIKVLLQVPTKEGLIQLPGAAGAGGGGSGTDYFVLNGTGKTFAAALSDAQNHTDRELYLTQAQIVMFSTRLTADQFNTLLDAIQRTPTIDEDVWVAATPTVEKALAFAPADSKHIPGLYFTTVFNCAVCENVQLGQRLWNIYQYQYSRRRDINMPYLLLGKQNFRLNQMAIYHHGRVADVLTPGQSITMGWIMGRPTRGTLSVKTHVGTVAIRDIRGRSHVSLRMVNGVPRETISVNLKGQLGQLSGENENLFHNIGTVESLTSNMAAQKMAATLGTLQQKGLDPLGLTLAYVWQHPELFAKPGSVSHFYERMHIRVRAKIRLSNLGGKT